MLYFDNNANCSICETTLKKYNKYSKLNNVSSYMPNEIKAEYEEFTKMIKDYYGAYNLIHTSGASESNSTVIYQFDTKSKFICISSDHYSVTGYLDYLSDNNNVIFITPNIDGSINEEDIYKNLPATCVFIQSVCSETGTIRSVENIYKNIKQQNKKYGYNTKLAIDDVQGFKKSKFDKNIGDYITISFHKVGGPIGSGMLLSKTKIKPMIFGKQNEGQRGGTINIAGILSSYSAIKSYKSINVSDYFLDKLNKKMNVFYYPDFLKHYKRKTILPNKYAILINTNPNKINNVVFMSLGSNFNILCGNAVKNFLITKGILIGTGSACNTNSSTKLGSLRSSDIIPEVQKGFIRISFYNNTKRDIDILIKEINGIFNK